MSYENFCVLCKHEADRNIIPGKDEFRIECRTCGVYFTDNQTDDVFQNSRSEEERAMISAFVRELFEYKAEPPRLHDLDDKEEIGKIIERVKMKTIYEKLNKLILYAEKKSNYFGENINDRLNSDTDYPVAYSKNIQEFENILNQAKESELLYSGSRENLTLTWEGWKNADEIKKLGPLSNRCYIAMSFDPSLIEIYDNGIEPAIREAGYEPIRLDKEEHNEKICDLIIAKIRSSKFLVADVTLQRQNVYYEAGFAQGLYKDVIWLCREDDMDNVHFDTRQYNHIIWQGAEDLKKNLFSRIKATIL